MNRETLFKASPEEAPLIAKKMQLTHWEKISQFCGVCGGTNEKQEADTGKFCTKCGHTTYPLIQPVAIVLIQRGDELLLAKGLPPRKYYSCLAGFVEAGETVEECLHREVKEEVGIEVENIKYFGSQPWPFPSNLMLGFIADYKSGDIVLEDEEITDAGWFTKDKPPELPTGMSIASRMIESLWG